MKTMMLYKGYSGSASFDAEALVFYGKIEFIRALITFEATEAKTLRNAFHQAVDDYLATCTQMGVIPEEPLIDNQNYFIASKVFFTEDAIGIGLNDGREIYVPLEFYPRLKNASKEQREDYELIGLGSSIHWRSLDEDLSVEGIVLGNRAIS